MTKQSLEEQLARLEEIAAKLDSPDVPLDKALALFEEGIKCLKSAQATLGSAEGRLKELVENADGTFGTTKGTPLKGDDD